MTLTILHRSSPVIAQIRDHELTIATANRSGYTNVVTHPLQTDVVDGKPYNLTRLYQYIYDYANKNNIAKPRLTLCLPDIAGQSDLMYSVLQYALCFSAHGMILDCITTQPLIDKGSNKLEAPDNLLHLLLPTSYHTRWTSILYLTIIVCVLGLGSLAWWTHTLNSRLRTLGQTNAIQSQHVHAQQKHVGSLDHIRTSNQKLAEQLKNIDTAPTRGNPSSMLAVISSTIPDDTWLTKCDLALIEQPAKAPSAPQYRLTLEGYTDSPGSASTFEKRCATNLASPGLALKALRRVKAKKDATGNVPALYSFVIQGIVQQK